jgi:hypothetical protein
VRNALRTITWTIRRVVDLPPKVRDLVAQDGDQLPALRTSFIQQISVVFPRRKVGEVDRKLLPPHHSAFPSSGRPCRRRWGRVAGCARRTANEKRRPVSGWPPPGTIAAAWASVRNIGALRRPFATQDRFGVNFCRNRTLGQDPFLVSSSLASRQAGKVDDVACPGHPLAEDATVPRCRSGWPRSQ